MTSTAKNGMIRADPSEDTTKQKDFDMKEEKHPQAKMELRSPFLKKLDNFFYHYKWHTIISLFLAVVLLVCSLQFCSKEAYDIEIMYAGPKSLNDRQIVLDIQNAFGRVSEDYNGDGKGVARMVSYWVDERCYGGTEDETVEGTDAAYFANSSLNNERAYVDEIAAGNLSICLLSPYLFYKVHKEGGFMRIDEICPELDESLYHKGDSGAVNHYGIVLSKTEFGKQAGLSSLPPDTILCIRKPAYHLLNASRVEEQHARSLEVFLSALRYENS